MKKPNNAVSVEEKPQKGAGEKIAYNRASVGLEAMRERRTNKRREHSENERERDREMLVEE